MLCIHKWTDDAAGAACCSAARPAGCSPACGETNTRPHCSGTVQGASGDVASSEGAQAGPSPAAQCTLSMHTRSALPCCAPCSLVMSTPACCVEAGSRAPLLPPPRPPQAGALM